MHYACQELLPLQTILSKFSGHASSGGSPVAYVMCVSILYMYIMHCIYTYTYAHNTSMLDGSGSGVGWVGKKNSPNKKQ